MRCNFLQDICLELFLELAGSNLAQTLLDPFQFGRIALCKNCYAECIPLPLEILCQKSMKSMKPVFTLPLSSFARKSKQRAGGEVFFEHLFCIPNKT